MMRYRGFWVIGSIVFGGVALGIATLGGTNLPGQNTIVRTPFQPGVRTHTTLGNWTPEVSVPNASESAAELEAVSSAPPTRGSIMAKWQKVSGANGYLLDVSTNESFRDYVQGYHDLDVGDVSGRVVTGLNPRTTYYYRVRPYTATGPSSYLEVMAATTVPTTGLTIHATFDSSITGNPNAAAIQAMINRAISIQESLFSDPITIQIRFRYATTGPDGSHLPQGTVSRSDFVVYGIPWSAFINALRADATTDNDNVANAHLPGNALSPTIKPSSANGRAVGLNTPTAMFADGHVGNGGPYDGIVTLNSSVPLQFTRPTNASNFDAQRSTEHEMDEVMGIVSDADVSKLHPQDVFSWSSAGHRNITSSGTRYFSINGGVTNIVNFNQDSHGDLGDWRSEACPQAHPYVQNAFACKGQFSDLANTSPEAINLDVIGYDLRNAAPTNVTNDFNNDSHPDYLLFNAGSGRTVVWYMNNNVHIASTSGPTLPLGWDVVSVADFNQDDHPDYLLYNSSTHQTAIWYLVGATLLAHSPGPVVPGGWQVVAASDFNGNGQPDLVLYRPSTRQTVIWYMNNNVRVGSAAGPILPSGWSPVAVADFNGDGHPDYLLFRPSTGQSVIWYLSGITRTGSRSGPTIPAGYDPVGVADFDGNGRPDYVLYNSNTHQTAIWYLDNNLLIDAAFGPTLPGGWSLAAP
jgi:elongation factor P hydroxylase